MRLLVSVRSVEEVAPALAGGAAIIDAKEPDRGSLGAVDRAVLLRILQQVPAELAVSVALGDVTRPEEIHTALSGLVIPERVSPVYLKLGFAGVRSRKQIALLLETVVRCAGEMAASPSIVAVAYADALRSDTIPPALIPSLAQEAGACGVLLDTHAKDGRGLLEWVPSGALVDWVARARRAGLLTALAGSLEVGDLGTVGRAQPDVVGIRGAACAGGRWGKVSEERVCQFRQGLERAIEGYPEKGALSPVRETRDTGAISSRTTASKSRKLKA